MAKKKTNCPFCKNVEMMERDTDQVIKLIIPGEHAVMRLFGSVSRVRGRWLECPNCRFLALFRKDPRDP